MVLISKDRKQMLKIKSTILSILYSMWVGVYENKSLINFGSELLIDICYSIDIY